MNDAKQEPVAWIVNSGDLRWFAWAKPPDGLYDGPIIPLYRTTQTCPYVVGRTTQHCSLTPLAEKERAELQSEIGKLRLALARIADENATFSVIGGNIIVDVEPMLTDAEREAIAYYVGTGGPDRVDATLRSLLERTK